MLKQYDCGEEEYHQITLNELWSQKEGTSKDVIFATSRAFAMARKQMLLNELKTLYYALTKIRFKQQCPEVIMINKYELGTFLGLDIESDYLNRNLNRAIGKMPKHSFLQFKNEKKGAYDNGNFIRRVNIYGDDVRIWIEPCYLPLFGELDSYIIGLITDIQKCSSDRSILFYEYLMAHTDSRLKTNAVELGVKPLKELFRISKETYVDKKTGHFDRSKFEKRIIDPICNNLSKTEKLTLLEQSDGKYYTKIYRGSRVAAYHFDWVATSRPRIATAIEVKELQEKVDKNPQILKVAKDIVAGKEKPEYKLSPKKECLQNDFLQGTLKDDIELIELLSDIKYMKTKEEKEKYMRKHGYEWNENEQMYKKIKEK